MKRRILAAVLACAVLPASAAMVEKPVEWTIGKDRFAGVLVYDDANDTLRPGLVMVPNWRGVQPASVEHAKRIAGRDYVILVADMYGATVRPKNNDEAGKAAAPLRENRPLLRERAQKSVEVLRAQAGKAPVDAARIGAIGFCFGGTTVLELVRAGDALAGVVSLHGGLAGPVPAPEGGARTPVLVLNGAADRAVSDEEILAFEKEMDAAGADWQFVNYSGAVHCFAEESAGNDPASNCRYDARASARAHRAMADFFNERFAASP